MPRRRCHDRWLFLTAGLLVIAGAFIVGSASHYQAMNQGLHAYHFLVRHLVHIVLGGIGFLIMLSVPYDRLADRKLLFWLLVGSLAALIFVFAMPAAGGAHRWFRIGPLSLQPSEFVKLVAILFMASVLSRKQDRINELFAVPIPCLAVIGLLSLLIAIEPDLGSAVMLAATAFIMIFVAGLRWRYIWATLGVGVVLFAVAVVTTPFRIQRIKTFLDPAADVHGSGFQLMQSLIAVGNGGLTGVGFGQGQQKALYLPAAHTDFIFSVIGEELGMIGALTLVAAFMLLLWRGLRTAVKIEDPFGSYVALGITSLLVLQGLVHIGVCVGLLPTKGLPLPFISYGGSSLLASMAMIGLLLNVSQHAMRRA